MRTQRLKGCRCHQAFDRLGKLVKTPHDTLLPRWDMNSVFPSTVFPLSCVAETRTQGFKHARQGLYCSTGSAALILWPLPILDHNSPLFSPAPPGRILSWH